MPRCYLIPGFADRSPPSPSPACSASKPPPTSLSPRQKRRPRRSGASLANLFHLSVQRLLQLVQCAIEIFIIAPLRIDLLDRVHHGGVVLAAELPPNLRQRRLGELFCQIHRDLPRHHDRAGIVL